MWRAITQKFDFWEGLLAICGQSRHLVVLQEDQVESQVPVLHLIITKELQWVHCAATFASVTGD